MAVATGTQIRPELSAVDYTPFVQAATQGAQMQAQSIANLGQTVASGIDQYLKKKEEKQREKEATTFLTTFINNNPEVANSLGIPLNLKGEVEDPGVVKAAIKTLGGADKALGLATSLRRFEQEKRMAELQMGAIEREAELAPIRQQLLDEQLRVARLERSKREQEEKNIRAMTAAYGAVPQFVPEIEREIVQGYAAPTPMLGEFMYGKVAPAIEAQKGEQAISKLGDARTKLEAINKETRDVFNAIKRLNTEMPVTSPVGFGPFGAGTTFFPKDKSVPRELEKFVLRDESGKPISFKDKSGKTVNAIDSAALTNFSSAQLSKQMPLVKEIEGLTERTARASIPFRQGIAALPSSSIIEKAAKVVERTVSRNATTDEKMAAFIPAYLKNEGTITPGLLDDMKKVFKSEMDVYDVGDGITVVRVGNTALPFDRNKSSTPNASLVRDFKAQQYQNLLSQLAAKSDWETLAPGERQMIAELASAHERGQNEMGIRRTAEEAFIQRRLELMGVGTAAPSAAPAGAGARPAGARPAARPTTTSLAPGWSQVR
jgi:hypothetical protein